MKVLLTGAEGYLGPFITAELLLNGHQVVGLDNFSKYGPCRPSFGTHPGYRFVFGDAGDSGFVEKLLCGCDYFIACAALTGGVPFLSRRPYDILSENDRITRAAFDAAIGVKRENALKRVVLISSSAVYENADVLPSPESQADSCPAPATAYGLQKLSAEFYAKSACLQYGVDYTIIRPFNAAGVAPAMTPDDAEERFPRILRLSTHAIPQLAAKIAAGANPLRIFGDGTQVRSFIHGRDLARGIRIAMEHPRATMQAFNMSSTKAVSLTEIIEMLRQRLALGTSLRIEGSPALSAEVPFRAADMTKTRNILNFETEIELEEIVDEVAAWVAGLGVKLP